MLNTPVLSRYVALGLIPLNAWAQVRGTHHFSFNALTLLFAIVVIGKCHAEKGSGNALGFSQI